MSIRQRIRDYLREREIRRLSAGQMEARRAGDKAKERHFDAMRMQAIKERSLGQVERMEISQGLRARTTIKQHVMRGYCRGLVPASVVTFVFRLFRLRSL